MTRDAVRKGIVRAALAHAAAHFRVETQQLTVTSVRKRRHRTRVLPEEGAVKREFYEVTIQDQSGTELTYRAYGNGEVHLVWPRTPLPPFDQARQH